MKSRLAGGFPSINAFTIDLGIVSEPYSKGALCAPRVDNYRSGVRTARPSIWHRRACRKRQFGILYTELPQATSPDDDNSAAVAW